MCYSNGKACVASLELCSTYAIAAGCTGMIGSEGHCIADTAAGSSTCRPIICNDAPSEKKHKCCLQHFLIRMCYHRKRMYKCIRLM